MSLASNFSLKTEGRTFSLLFLRRIVKGAALYMKNFASNLKRIRTISFYINQNLSVLFSQKVDANSTDRLHTAISFSRGPNKSEILMLSQFHIQLSESLSSSIMQMPDIRIYTYASG